MKTRDTYKRQARLFKALANESRLLIIERLSHGEATAGELTALVGTDASTVSKHLSLLRAAGIVEDRRAGASVYYRLLTPCVMNFFVCIDQVLDQGETGQ